MNTADRSEVNRRNGRAGLEIRRQGRTARDAEIKRFRSRDWSYREIAAGAGVQPRDRGRGSGTPGADPPRQLPVEGDSLLRKSEAGPRPPSIRSAAATSWAGTSSRRIGTAWTAITASTRCRPRRSRS